MSGADAVRTAWNGVYAQQPDLWTRGADATLCKYLHLVQPGPVLDVAVGPGRNSLFLARRGYEVDGFDISARAVATCQAAFARAGIEGRFQVADVREVEPEARRYNLVVACWILPFLSRAEVLSTLAKLKTTLAPGGLLYTVVFSNYEPAEAERGRDGITRFEFMEYLSLHRDLELIHAADVIGKDYSHGNPHHHGYIEYMGRRP